MNPLTPQEMVNWSQYDNPITTEDLSLWETLCKETVDFGILSPKMAGFGYGASKYMVRLIAHIRHLDSELSSTQTALALAIKEAEKSPTYGWCGVHPPGCDCTKCNRELKRMELINNLRALDGERPSAYAETDHSTADDLLIEYIDDPDIEAAYECVGKWYA